VKPVATAAALALASLAAPAGAQEAFAGLYVHGVDTPLTLHTGESGADVAVGYRLAPLEPLRAIGAPAPYLIASVNSGGDTSFAGVGLSWRFNAGRVYLRPAVAIVVHDGPERRFHLPGGLRTDLGSRVLFEPEVGIGYQLDERLAVELSWMHVSHAQLFDRKQNPGIDMIGARLNWRLR
jgi:hypothetical protein